MLLILCLPAGCFAGEDEPTLRVDNAGDGLPRNLRLETGDLWKDSWNPDSYREDPGFEPSVEGLSTLYMSGSLEYTEAQFRAMTDRIREVMPAGAAVWIFDLRQERHGFVDCEAEQDGKTVACRGISMYWHGDSNAANAGRNLEEVTKDEKTRFDAIAGKQVDVQGRLTPGAPWPSRSPRPSSTPLPAGVTPTPRPSFDPSAFQLPTSRIRVWMHFHCMAGVGRTGIYMCLYDMMKNPDVPYKDILARQTMLGSHNPVSSDPKSGSDQEKNRLMPLLYQYVQENHAENYEVSWSRWLYLREHSTPIPEAAEVPEARNAFSPALMPVITAGVRGLLVFLALRILLRSK